MADITEMDSPKTVGLPDALNKVEQIPQEGDPKVGRFLYGKFKLAKAEKDRLKLHQKWMKNAELKRGEMFKQGQFSIQAGGKSYALVPVNLHHKVISQTKANLTDNKPRFEIVPHSDLESENAPMMNAAANFWWKQTKQQKKLSESIDKSETYGSSIEKIWFDPTLEGGLGDVDTFVRDPFKIFPWPGVQDIQRMPFWFDVEVMELSDIQRRWPETGMTVKHDKEWSTLLGKRREEIMSGTLSKSAPYRNVGTDYVETQGTFREPRIDRALVIECWMKDYTMVDQPVFEQVPITDEFGEMVIDETTGQPMTQEIQTGTEQVPKYPGFIRVVHFANKGQVVLDDIPNPSVNPNLPPEIARNTYLWDKYPYIKNDAINSDVNFWGYSIIEQLEVLVREINRKISMIASYINKTVKPPMIIPANSGIKKEDVHNLPGMVLWPTNQNVANAIRAVQIPSLPSDYFNFIELMMRLVDIISGIQDVTEGRKPTGIAAASAIIALQEKAETIFREKVRNTDLLLEEKGRMWISHAQNWYTETRKVVLSGDVRERIGQQFMEFNGAEQFQGEYSFDVESGSTMPKSILAQREQALQLFQNGAIDQKALLDAFDFPNRIEIMQRMNQGAVGQMLERLIMVMETDPAALRALGLSQLSEQDLMTIQQVLSLDDKTFKKIFALEPPVKGGIVKEAGSAGQQKSLTGKGEGNA